MAITISGTKSTTRTNLGLGSSSTLTTGTSANNAVQLDSNGHVPAVDGSQLTNKPTNYNSPAFYVKPSANFTISDATWTTLTTQLDTTTLNDGSRYFTSGTDAGRFKPNVAGWYHIESIMHADAGGANLVNLFAAIYRGGSGTGDGLIVRSEQQEGGSNANEQSTHTSALIQMDGVNDYVYMQTYCDDSSGSPTMIATGCNFFGFLIHAT